VSGARRANPEPDEAAQKDEFSLCALLEWLREKRDKGVFTSVKDYRRKVPGHKGDTMRFKGACAVTLEISPFRYFPWIISQAKQCVGKGELIPGRGPCPDAGRARTRAVPGRGQSFLAAKKLHKEGICRGSS
jgi:hypothetical protein